MASPLRRRLRPVATHGARHVVVPLLNVAVSASVIRLTSVSVWGELIHVMLIVHLAAHIMGWGNKDWVLREISSRPAAAPQIWGRALVSRWPLLVAAVAGLIAWQQPWPRAGFILAWCLGLVLQQSTEALVLYRKRFLSAAVVDVVGVGALVAGVWLVALDVDALIALFAAVHLGRAGAMVLVFGGITFGGAPPRPDFAYLAGAATFLLIGLSGMLQSRIDVYCIDILMEPAELGRYQVFINLMFYVHMAGSLMVQPFAAGIYRLGPAGAFKMSARLFAAGVFIVPGGVGVAHLILTLAYGITIAPVALAVGGAFALATYFYSPIIYALFGAGAQSQVIGVTALSLGVGLVLNLWWIPDHGLLGAVGASAVSQWAMAVSYFILGRRLLRS